MASFPTMRSGKIAMNGTSQGLGFKVSVVEFENGSEQRFKRRRQLFECTLVFTRIKGYDHGQVMDFFNSMKGRFDNTWDLTLEGDLWDNMVFIEDEFRWTYLEFYGFSGRIKCRQVRKN